VFTKDYYRILGVMPSAEGVVIRAAYKALAQRYHPDKYQGDASTAKRLMQDINEAYSILSDAAKKNDYDAWYKEQRKQEEFVVDDAEDEELASALNAFEKDWKLACNIYPDLHSEFERLNKVAHRLGLTFKIMLLESKQFSNRKTLAAYMENEFFRAYFGQNTMILMFAREIVLAGHKKAAKALNDYIRVLGSDPDAIPVIDRICEDYNLPNERRVREEKEIKEKAEQEQAVKAMKEGIEKSIQDKINRRARLSADDRKYIGHTLDVKPENLTQTYSQCSSCGYFGPIEAYEDNKRGFFSATMYRCPKCKNTDGMYLQ
jgi:curved DNA-binding protein CbpA